MARLVTLFTGQWADLPAEEMARKTNEFGYDGIELACWGDHFEVDKALAEDSYCARKRELLDRYDLQCRALSAHLVGQAVCDLIDARHQEILPPEIYGDGEPEGVRQRAAQRLIDTAKAARIFRDAGPDDLRFPMVVSPLMARLSQPAPYWLGPYPRMPRGMTRLG